ncbi:MAG: peptide-methionine (S)-S-oxide reductase MsrA [Tunicatimonas sp.]
MNYLLSFLSFILLFSCQSPNKTSVAQASLTVEPAALTDADKQQLDTATFAGGCFWCTEAVFERVRGVRSVVSGYTGGQQKDPTYEQVSAGRTSHAEGIQVYFNPDEITYEDLVKIFFGTHDPTQLNRQGPDVGKQYRSAVYYHNPQQKAAVEAHVQELSSSGKYDKPIVTQVEAFEKFYDAEGYHQNYYENNPNNPYIMSVAKPKVKKLIKNYPDYLKDNTSS